MVGSSGAFGLAFDHVQATESRAPLTRARKLGAIALLGAAVALGAWWLPFDRWLLGLAAWIQGAGAVGVVTYSIVYVLATVLLLPGSVLTLAAGFAYGPVWGTLLISPVSVTAATLAFLLGRSVFRGWVLRRVAGDPRFAAIDKAVGDNGFKIVLLLRLSPVFPFNLLNYALGVTGVSLGSYVLASFIGMLPGTFLYVYLGSLVTNASQITSGTARAGAPGQVLYFTGLVATLVVTVLITRIARKALREAIGSAGDLAGPPKTLQ